MPCSRNFSTRGVRLIAALAVGGLTACSPYAFSDGARGLSTKMTAIDATSKDTARKITAEKRQTITLGWLRDRPQLARGPGCLARAPVSVPCDLVAFGQPVAEATRVAPVAAAARKPATPAKDVCQAPVTLDASASAEPAKPPAALTRADVPKRLDDYFAALAAITNAKDRSEFDTASAEISEAVSGLAESAGTPGGGTVAQATTSVAFWLVGQGYDYKRLEELRRATAAACQPIHVLTDALKALLEEQQKLRMAALTKLLILQVQTANRLRTTPGTNEKAYATSIENAQATADAYQAVKATDPAATAQALSDAHDALVVAIRDDDGQFAAMVATLTALTDQVDALETAATTSSATTAGAKAK